MKILPRISLAAFIGTGCFTMSGQAATILDFRDGDAATPAGTVNVTSKTPQDITNPLFDTQGKRDGTPLGIKGSWGGGGANPLLIDGQQVEFTITSIVDFDGSSPDAKLRTATTHGFGIDSAGTVESWFELDGQESFTWKANKDIAFEGMFLKDWDVSGISDGKNFSISSASWIGLGLSDNATDGVTFDDSTGTFTLLEVDGNTISQGNGNNGGIITLNHLVGDSGTELSISASEAITISSINGDLGEGAFRDGIQIKTMTFAAVPELGTYALLAGCVALASVMIRRRR